MRIKIQIGLLLTLIALPGLLGAKPIGEFPEKDDKFFIRMGTASHRSAMIANTLALQNSRALNQAILGHTNLMIPVTEPKTETYFINTWELGYSFGSDSGIHRGTLTARYMGGRTLPQNIAQINRTTSTDSSSTGIETLHYQYDIYDSSDLRRYSMRYISDINFLTGAGSDYVEGLGLRAGVNLDHSTYQTSGYRVESSVNYVTSSGSTTANLVNANINRINEIDTDLNSFELIGGLVYKFPIMKRLHADIGVDHYRGQGRGEAVYKSLSAPDGSTLNSVIQLTGTDFASAQTISSSISALLAPIETNRKYYTDIVGNVYNIGLTFHISPYISLRGYYRDEKIQHSVRKSKTNGIGQDIEPLIDAAIAAQLSGQAINFNQAALQTFMSNVDDLGPLPEYTDRIKEGGIEIQIRF